MSVDFGKVFGKAFGYALSLDRLLPFFIVNTIFILLILFFIDSVLTSIAALGSGSSAFVFTFLSMLFGFLGVAIIISLIQMFFTGAITDNARQFYEKKERPIKASFGIVKKKYFSILGAAILAGIISGFVGAIPYIGWVFSILAGLSFLFIDQFIIIANKKAVDALGSSYNLFKNNWADVLIYWLLLIIIGIPFIFVALIPIVLAFIPVFTGAIGSQSIALFLKNNMLFFFIAGLFASAVLSYFSVFQESAKTFFFMRVKKK